MEKREIAALLREAANILDAEIDAHLAKEEERKKAEDDRKYDGREGLEEGDACECDPISILKECRDIGIPVVPVGCLEAFVGGVSYYAPLKGGDGVGVALYAKTSDREKEVRKMSAETFLRLAKMTAAKLKAEEEAKPIPFGTPVKWDDKNGTVACHHPNEDNKYLVTYEHEGTLGTYALLVSRDKLTIIPSNQ